jgi:hypothetical protein
MCQYISQLSSFLGNTKSRLHLYCNILAHIINEACQNCDCDILDRRLLQVITLPCILLASPCISCISLHFPTLPVDAFILHSQCMFLALLCNSSPFLTISLHFPALSCISLHFLTYPFTPLHFSLALSLHSPCHLPPKLTNSEHQSKLPSKSSTVHSSLHIHIILDTRLI